MSYDEKNEKTILDNTGAIWLFVLAAIFLVCVFFGSYVIIEPGYDGVMFNKVTGGLRAVQQGMTFKVPFITTVQEYPVALRTFTLAQDGRHGDDSIDLPTKEGQHIKQDISITYNTSPEKAAEVFKAFKGADIQDIESTYIRRTIMTIAQNAAGQMSLSDLISSDRAKLQDSIYKDLGTELLKMGFFLDKVNLGASHLPETIENQMQQKMAAQQQAQQAEYELQKQKMLAQALVAQSEGKAQALLIEANAQSKANNLLQQTLTPLLVQNKTVDKWNGQLPQITGTNALIQIPMPKNGE